MRRGWRRQKFGKRRWWWWWGRRGSGGGGGGGGGKQRPHSAGAAGHPQRKTELAPL